MISFPHAKVNLGLHIISRRDDGYHNLETCFYPVPEVCDALEMIESESDSLVISGMEWQEPVQQNLVWKAMDLFRTLEPDLPPMAWQLLKKIPAGGGLGGGSSNAAFALRMMAGFCNWPKADPRLFAMALKLGSDCPFFLEDGPRIAMGRGEVFTPIKLDLSLYRFEFVFPGIHVSTADAFARITPREPKLSIENILQMPASNWRSLLTNDFEEAVFRLHPELAMQKESLYERGAVYASMSGSGSTLFGIFER